MATDSDLKYVIAADNSKYERTMDKVSDKAGAVSKKIKVGMAAAAAAAGAAFVKMATDGVKSFAEIERKMLRTESLIKATGNAAGLTSAEILDFANKLDLATLNDRDAILGAVNALQTFKSISGDTFKRSIELAADLSEVLGQGISSGAVQLGKALEDPIQGINALRRVGVSFTAEQKEFIKSLVDSGKQVEAQGKILDVLAEQVGGAAKGAAGGLSGKVDTLSFRWREYKETMVETSGILSITTGAVDLLTKALEHQTKQMTGPAATVKDLQANLSLMQKSYEVYADKSDMGERFAKRRRALAKNIADTKAQIDELQGAYTDLWQVKQMPAGADETAGDILSKSEIDKEIENQRLLDAQSIIGLTTLMEIDEESRKQAELEQIRKEANEKKIAESFEWLTIYGEHQAEEMRLKRETEKAKAAIDRQAAKAALSNTKAALAEFGKSNETAFKIWQGISVAEATVAMFKSAVIAYGQGMAAGGPWAGPIVAAAYAAAALAFGAAQISAILSASPGGKGSAAGTTSISPTTVSATPSSTSPVAEIEPAFSEDKEKGQVNFYIQGDMVGDDVYIDRLVERINMAGEDREVNVYR